MKTIQIFDPALCCSTGVCGTTPDETLLAFAADVDWAKKQGAIIERFNLAQQPLEFAKNMTVKSFLERSGEGALPLILIDGEVALAGRYPTRSELVKWAELKRNENAFEATTQSCCGENNHNRGKGKCC